MRIYIFTITLLLGFIAPGFANENDRAELTDLAQYSQAVILVRVTLGDDSILNSQNRIVQDVTVAENWKTSDGFLEKVAYKQASEVLRKGMYISSEEVGTEAKSIDYVVFCLFPIGDGITFGPVIRRFQVYEGKLLMNGHPCVTVAEAKQIVSESTETISQKNGVDLLTADEITVGHNPDGSPIKVKVIRAPKQNPYTPSPVGDFDTAHERDLRQRSQSVGEIGLPPSLALPAE